jgi:putative heme-binding domain-containing protein
VEVPVYVIAWTVLLLLQQGLYPDLPATEKNPFTSPADLELGKKNYNGRCAGCDGPTGDGGKGTNLATPKLPRAQRDLMLYRIIRYGLPDTEMPGHNMTQREIWQIAAYVRTLGRAGAETISGDPARGELLVKRKGGCTACHVLNGQGGLTGPALTDIGTRRSPSYLRTKLIDPAKELSGGFSIVRLATRGGEKLSGVRLNEDTWSIQVRDNDGRLHSFWKEDLADLTVEQRTLMPSYAKQLEAHEIDDIVAYLSATGGR